MPVKECASLGTVPCDLHSFGKLIELEVKMIAIGLGKRFEQAVEDPVSRSFLIQPTGLCQSHFVRLH